ncbi:MAG: NAD(P)/FAD-dependent oxidoreductase [Pseudomonadota bacterium]
MTKVKTTPGLASEHHEAIVIGAGFSGIGMGIKLDEAGLGDFLILEQGDGIGGAWHFNTYPGVAVDIPSLSYSFSFERNSHWSRVFAPGAELKAYAEHCVDKYRLRSRIRLNTSVVNCVFDEKSDFWQISTSTGQVFTARFLVGATGVLTQPKNPDIAGIDSFKGVTMHTARWDHGVDLKGKRVAIIGTGASALQVIPEIAPEVKHLTVFQRTPIWVMPKPDTNINPLLQTALEKSTLLQWSARMLSQGIVEFGFVLTAHYHRYFKLAKIYERLGRDHLQKQVKDPVTRAKLTPNYGFACKRPSTSNTYLQAFNRDNVALVTTPIDAVTEHGVRTQDGTVHDIDILICATGFKVFESGNMPPFPIVGVGGRDLEGWWNEYRYQAYEGVSMPGFPNIFMILGPNGYNGASYFQLIELQARHIVRCLKAAQQKGASRVEVTRQANDRYFKAMKARSDAQVFFNNSCGTANSYYFDKHGDVPFRPATSVEAQWRSMTFPMSDYEFSGSTTIGK